MKKLLFALFISIISVVNISCKAQDNIGWVQSDIVYENINYGLLYNYYAVVDSRNIANVGWHVPSNIELENLAIYVGGKTSGGGNLKETGTIYWLSPNTGATNLYNFNARGGSSRLSDGTFSAFNGSFTCWSSTQILSTTADRLAVFYNNTIISIKNDGTSYPKKSGYSIRLIADSGNPTTYTGNDGKVYRCVTINGVTYTADNLAETKYRDGTDIPQVTDATTWSGLTTGAWCYYNNDPTKK